jgi:dTDP-4-dehydrorhamnose 3,5-epimerase
MVIVDTDIVGVHVRPLMTHADARGSLTELFRDEWGTGIQPVQWNASHSAPNVLRGVHVHPRHADYLILVQGRTSVGLRDLRRGSPTEGRATLIEMSAERPSAILIPPGVAHGFFFHEPSIHLYAVDTYWDQADELGCHWADPALEIPWPVTDVLLSGRDANAPPVADLLRFMPAYRPVSD